MVVVLATAVGWLQLYYVPWSLCPSLPPQKKEQQLPGAALSPTGLPSWEAGWRLAKQENGLCQEGDKK